MSIQFVDLKAQFAALEADIRSAIDRVLVHGKFIMGPEIEELEQKLAEFVGVEYALTCASGTDALLMPLMAEGLGPGDAVFTTPFTFIATAEVIALVGATPVFVDIDPRTFNIDPKRLEEAVAKVQKEGRLNARAVIPVDLFGLPADYDAITPIAERHGLFVLEDAAQSLGAEYRGRRAGSLGHAGATSFFPAKPLGCYGDGGAVFTNDAALYEKVRSIRVHGQGNDRYDNVRIGVNSRLDTLQAAILLPKLEAFPEELAARERAAQYYSEVLSDVLEVPFIPDGSRSAWAQYSILSEERSTLQARLHDAGIPSAVYYPKPLHLQTAFSYLGYQRGDFPVSERTAERILSLPMHPYLVRTEVDAVIDALADGTGIAPRVV